MRAYVLTEVLVKISFRDSDFNDTTVITSTTGIVERNSLPFIGQPEVCPSIRIPISRSWEVALVEAVLKQPIRHASTRRLINGYFRAVIAVMHKNRRIASEYIVRVELPDGEVPAVGGAGCGAGGDDVAW